MKSIASLVCLLLLATFALPAEITGDVNVKAQKTVQLQVTGIAPKGSAVWTIKPMDGQDAKEIEWVSGRNGPSIRWIAPQGKYSVTVLLASLDKDGTLLLDTTDTTVTIGVPGPGPSPPGPNPPGPNPPGPAPIPTSGLRVLMVFETLDKGKMPKGQVNIAYAKAVRDYLNSKCVVGADGKTKEYRMWDKDVDTTEEGKVWQDAMKRERKSLPWILISDGIKGYEGPLPATVDDTLTLLKKYGG